MSRKLFLVLVAMLVVLAGAAALALRSEQASWKSAESGGERRLFPQLKVADVAEVALRGAAGELHLARSADGWSIRERADFPADTSRIAELLVKIAELRAVQRQPLPSGQRADYQLVEPGAKSAQGAGTLIELKDAKSAVLARVLLGKKIFKSSTLAPTGAEAALATGRYLLVGGDSDTLLAVAEPFNEAEPKPQDWMAKDLIRVDRAKSITAIGADGRTRWTIRRDREAADWTFADAKVKPDLQKATDVSSSLAWVNLDDVVADPGKVDSGLDHPTTLKAETFDGLTYTVMIGNRAGDDYYLRYAVTGEPPAERAPEKSEKPEDKAKKDKEFQEQRKKLLERVEREKKLERWTYLVPKTTVDPLLRDRAQLMPEKKKAEAKKT